MTDRRFALLVFLGFVVVLAIAHALLDVMPVVPLGVP